ncbi:GntR family transcriptional regulator/MocR family aminotransferase [Inquilinus ginsengisoli]|uniref:GntR family transcriptional regulator/MocR family aminotransferase n=1 Tax=Inquilinus ginsengisoli TaxID=363840 RepID=A0ABU1JH98_9PROT|nr:PLP-dependent aminotransferase family protein [Inquilinus ginsengisoli]MDR6287986.1 GntR family transcriptional regulator/MocR family aminotransferase [Inquilinus ginsengisoli]
MTGRPPGAAVRDRPVSWVDLIDLGLDPDDRRPLFQQLHLALRDLIARRVVPAGTRLPATRILADRLGVSRTTVVAAYDQLQAEGVVAGRVGAGTYVASEIEARDERPGAAVAEPPGRDRPAPAAWRAETLPFATGFCGMHAVTERAWGRLVQRHLRGIGIRQRTYGDPLGDRPLREAIAEYLRVARSVVCDADRIALVSGSQQGLDLILRVLARAGDPAWIEDPCYPAALAAMRQHRLDILPVPVDDQGLDVAAGLALRPDARLVYCTPTHHYPLGVAMSLARRLQLLDWARDGRWVIEDDYDSEFRFSGRPLSALQGLDRHDRVVYLGTLSKVLFPGLRIGYVVLPPQLVDGFAAVRNAADRFPSSVLDDVLVDFINEGHFTRHIRRMRQEYGERRERLIAALQAEAGDHLTVAPIDRGMYLVADLRPGLDDCAVAEAARRRGVVVRPLSPMHVAAPPRSALILGFTGFSPQALDEAARTLGAVLRGFR